MLGVKTVSADSFTDDELRRLYAALRSELNNLSVQNIRNTVAAAGFDVTRITARSEARSGSGSRAEVMPAVDSLFGEMAQPVKLNALRILAEKLVKQSPELTRDVQGILGKHGFQFLDGTFVPVDLLDSREARYLPTSSAAELARATNRLVSGDLSGAITAACGAVDLATQGIYETLNLGDPGAVSFSAKVNTALDRLKVFDEIKREYLTLGISEADASDIVENTRRATNHMAQALQTLRKRMGDVHGSRPAVLATAYNAVKWASAICAFFEGKF
jgi:hypothetical protein